MPLQAMTAEPSNSEVNLYRKQHGNVKQIFMTGKFETLVSLCNSTLSVAPNEALEV